MSRWVSVKDELPPLDVPVLVFDGLMYVTDFSGYMLDCLRGDDYDLRYIFISHWMPLPEAPTDGE